MAEIGKWNRVFAAVLIGLALAANVSVEQITSSPGRTPSSRSDRWIAAVPEARAVE